MGPVSRNGIQKMYTQKLFKLTTESCKNTIMSAAILCPAVCVIDLLASLRFLGVCFPFCSDGVYLKFCIDIGIDHKRPAVWQKC